MSGANGNDTPSRSKLRKQEKGYRPYNHDPKTVGSLTGKPMPTGVRRDSEGFEDVNDFFRSPDTTRTNAPSTSLMAAATSIQGGTSAAKSNRSASNKLLASVSKRGETSTRSRFGGVEDEDEEQDLEEDVLDVLGDLNDGLGSGEMSMDLESLSDTRRRSQIPNGKNRPPPSVNRPASSRLAPGSPNHDYDDLPGTEASPTSGRGGASSNKRQSIGRRQPRQEYTDDDEEAEQAAAAPASSRRFAPSDAAVSSRQRAVTAEEDEEADEADDSVDVEMGRNVMSGRSRGRGGISRRTEVRGSAETELGGQSEEDEAAARMALDPEVDGDDGMPANDYGGGVDDYDAGDQQDYGDGEEEPAGDEAEEEEPHQPLRKARGRPKKGKGKAKDTTGKENRPPPRPRASSKQARGHSEVLEPADDLLPVRSRLRTLAERTTPLEYWRGERPVFERPMWDEVAAPTVLVKEWKRIPKEEPLPFSHKRGRSASRAPGRAGSVKPPSKVGRGMARIHEDDEEDVEDVTGWDDNTEKSALTVDHATGVTGMRNVACPYNKYDFKEVLNAGGLFKYHKVFTEHPFFAAGCIELDPDGRKSPKPSKDNTYAFFVHKGCVEVTVHRTRFIMSEGGQFLVPRGNDYSFRNVCKQKVTLMFAQARLLREGEDIDDGDDSATPAPGPSRTAPAKQLNGKRKRALETEDVSDEPEQHEQEEHEDEPVKKNTGPASKKAARGRRK